MKALSQINTILTKEYLIGQRENQYFERKGIDTNPAKIADELIGMLNADGGVLAFGISDRGEIQDLKTIADGLDRYKTLSFDFINPACNIELEEIEFDGNTILLYHVEQDAERVFCRKDNDKIFLRVADTNRTLNRDQVKKLEYDKGIRKFEEEIEKDFEEEDLDLPLLEEYKQKINYNGDIFSLLTARHLLKKAQEKILFKKACVLLFSKNPEKYIPSASVRYIRYEGTEALTGTSHNVVKDERFEDNIPQLIAVIKSFLRTSLKDYYFLNIATGKFTKVPEYPEEAWLEGIVNALCHRSYNIQGNAVYIKHFDDRIEISNSGPLPAQVTIENIKTERFARNPRIARTLEDLGYARQLNEGVSRIYESMEKSMLSQPEYKEINNTVYLILRNKISSHSKTISQSVMEHIEKEWGSYSEIQKNVLQHLFLKQKATLTEFCTALNANEKTIRRHLNAFVKHNIMEKLSEKQRDINALYILKKH